MKQITGIVKQYFDAMNSRQVDVMIACFADDAVVHDVGESLQMRGRTEIKAWIEETHSKYALHAKPLDVSGDGSNVEVLNEISGSFDGSPLRFRHTFAVRDHLITSLSSVVAED